METNRGHGLWQNEFLDSVHLMNGNIQHGLSKGPILQKFKGIATSSAVSILLSSLLVSITTFAIKPDCLFATSTK